MAETWFKVTQEDKSINEIRLRLFSKEKESLELDGWGSGKDL